MFGISLGSYESSIAVIKNGKTEILANEGGERSTPMMVTISNNNSMLVGTQSKQAFYRNYESTAVDVMNLLGVSCESVMNDISKTINCKVVFKNGLVHFDIPNNKRHSVTEVLSLILKQLAVTAHLSDPVSPIPVVIATNDITEQKASLIRQCTKDCGFRLLGIHQSSSLSLLPYGLGGPKDSFSGHVLVYNMGLRTLTLSLLRSDNGMIRNIKHETYQEMGGAKLDQVILSVLKSEAERIFHKDVTQSNKRVLYKLLSAAESAKHALSSQTSTRVYIESLYEGMDFQYTLSRGKFEGVSLSLFKTFLSPVQPFLDSVGMALTDINKLILVGGTCKIPKLQQLLRELFNSSEVLCTVTPEYVATLGAAMQGECYEEFGLSNIEEGRLQCCPNDITMSSSTGDDSVLLLQRHTPLPCKQSVPMTVKVVNDVVVLKLQELLTSSSDDCSGASTTLAEISIPVSVLSCSNDVVKLIVDLVWDLSSAGLRLIIRDAQSDWRTAIDL